MLQQRTGTLLSRDCLTLAIMASVFSCKTPSMRPQSDIEASRANTGVTMAAMQGYAVDDTLLRELGSRVGCEKAANFVAFPRHGDLQDALKTIYATPAKERAYDRIRSEILNTADIEEHCRESVNAVVEGKTHVEGFLKFAEYVRKAGYGLTLVMHGGFGSHLTKGGALLGTRNAIQAAAASFGGTRSIRAWRIECSNSYAPDDICSQEMLDALAQKEKEEPSSLPQLYLFWGYSKGGTTIVQALGMSRELRDKTLAVITLSSPIGGGVALDLTEPTLSEAIAGQSELLSKNSSIAAAMPLAFAMTPDGYRDVINLLRPADLAMAQKGARSLLTATRKTYLYETLRRQDFSRTADPVLKREKIPIFHVAALLDIGRMHPFPAITYNNGVAIKENTQEFNHLEQMLFLPVFQNYPLSDSCVALQHSVIPKDALPEGLESELLGLLRTDHLSLQLSYGYGKDNPDLLPGLDIADAAIESAFIKLTQGSTK